MTRRSQITAAQSQDNAEEITVGDIYINSATREAAQNGEPLLLTALEFDLLLCLARSEGRVLNRDTLLDEIAGQQISTFSTVRLTFIFPRSETNSTTIRKIRATSKLCVPSVICWCRKRRITIKMAGVRFSLFLKIIIWFFLNLIILGAILLAFFSLNFRFSPNSRFAGIFNSNIESVTRQITNEADGKTRAERDAILRKYTEKYSGVEFFLFDLQRKSAWRQRNFSAAESFRGNY